VLFAPLAAFAASKYLLFRGEDSDSVAANVTSAAAAVVVLHVALGVFIYRAYFQEPGKAKVAKQE